MTKVYVITWDGILGYIDSICTCDGCKERGEVEFEVRKMDGTYLCNYTMKQIFNGDLHNMSYNINGLSTQCHNIEKIVAEMLHEKLLEKED